VIEFNEFGGAADVSSKFCFTAEVCTKRNPIDLTRFPGCG